MEEDLHDPDTVHRLRLHVLDVVDGGSEPAFYGNENPLGHVFGGDSRVGPDDVYDRNVDFREDVGWRAQ